MVNTVFALKYARLYYVDEDGGIDFRQDQPPTYSDLAYMAFLIGAGRPVRAGRDDDRGQRPGRTAR